MKRLYSVVAVCGSLVFSAQADEIDDLIQLRMSEMTVPGAALAILRDGEIEKESYYGNAVIEHGVPVTERTVFRIASITKSITTVAMLMLYERGDLDLDAPISRYVEEIPDEWGPITLRHLLSQTAGIAEPERESYRELFAENPDDFFKLLRTSELTEYVQLESAKRSPLSFEPGKGWVYSDTHFDVAGKVLQSITGVTLREFVKNEIFIPAGMTSAMYIGESDIVPHLAGTYAWGESRRLTRGPFTSDVAPAIPGGSKIQCTLRDLIRLELALWGNTLLKRETRDMMWKRTRLDSGELVATKWFNPEKDIGYGMGWFISGPDEHPIVLVPGITGTVWLRLPKDNITVIWLSNLRGAGQWIGRHEVLGLLLPELKEHVF